MGFNRSRGTYHPGRFAFTYDVCVCEDVSHPEDKILSCFWGIFWLIGYRKLWRIEGFFFLSFKRFFLLGDRELEQNGVGLRVVEVGVHGFR